MVSKQEKLAQEFLGIGRVYKLSFSKSNLQYDCSLKDMRVIEFLATGSKTMSQLAQEMQLTPGSMTTVIDKLIDSKHVTRIHDSEDRRKVTIKLLEKGKKIAQTIQSLTKDISQKMLEALTEKEQDALIHSLSKINEHLGKKI